MTHPGSSSCSAGQRHRSAWPTSTRLIRHACGFRLVNDGVDTRALAAYLGHRNMANTSRYTNMDSKRFDGFWQD
jgi:type 1 fimbriae regulatory protein FimB/type 1 fimbriae regulatory protein FimE